MGRDRPNADLVVSPQHRILLTIPQSGNIFDPGEVLAPAKALIQRRGVQHMRSIRQIEYHTVLLDRHALIIANGLTVESYYPAAYALSTLTQGQRNQIDALFPGVQQDVLAAYGPKVRRVLKTRDVRALIKLGHGMPLQSGERARLRLSAA